MDMRWKGKNKAEAISWIEEVAKRAAHLNAILNDQYYNPKEREEVFPITDIGTFLEVTGLPYSARESGTIGGEYITLEFMGVKFSGVRFRG